MSEAFLVDVSIICKVNFSRPYIVYFSSSLRQIYFSRTYESPLYSSTIQAFVSFNHTCTSWVCACYYHVISSRSTLFLNAQLYRFSVEFGLKYKMQCLHSSRHAIKEKDSLLLPFNFGNIWLSISHCPAEPLIFFKHCRSRSAGF